MKRSLITLLALFLVVAFCGAVLANTPSVPLEPRKWSQRPDMKNGVNIQSTDPYPIVADDFKCLDGMPLLESTGGVLILAGRRISPGHLYHRPE